MISADRIKKDDNWDGRSWHPHRQGVTVPNKETTMDWPEHQRIVLETSRLLELRPQLGGALQHITTAFFELYTAFREPNRFEITVTKGIHQPLNNPHMQLATRNRTSGALNRFHLAVSAQAFSEAEIARDGALDERFRWEGAQFTFIGPDRVYAWPQQAAVFHKPQRRNSIGPQELSAIRSARERVQAEVAARTRTLQTQSNKDGFDAAVIAFAAQRGIHSNVILCSNQVATLRNGKVATVKVPNSASLRLQYLKPEQRIALV